MGIIHYARPRKHGLRRIVMLARMIIRLHLGLLKAYRKKGWERNLEKGFAYMRAGFTYRHLKYDFGEDDFYLIQTW